MRGKRERRGSVLRTAAVLLGAAGLVAGIASAAAPMAAADSGLPTARSEMARSHTARNHTAGSHTAGSHTAGSKTAGSKTGPGHTSRKAARKKPAATPAHAGAGQVGAGGDGGAGAGPRTGTTDAAGAAAAAKPLVRLSRVRTAMSIVITPAHPYRDGRLVASGTVTQLTAKGWVRLPHAHVVLVYRPRGSSQWYWVLKGHAGATGRYTFVTRAYADGTWAVYLDPDSRHLHSESRKVYVTVR